MARLDRLGDAKQVAQTAAAIGREFQRDLLARVMSDAASLEHSLGELVEAGLLYRRGVAPADRFVFKHALVQDAALDSMLRRTRQSVHKRIAEVLEADFPAISSNEPEVVAHHYSQAGDTERAVHYWCQAGQRAARRSAYVETVSHLTEALRSLSTFPESPERHRQELAVQTMLGPAQMAVHGFASDAVEGAYNRARELCELTGHHEQLVQILYGLFRLSLLRGHIESAYSLAKDLLVEGGQSDERGALITAHRAIGNSAIWLGHAEEARDHLLSGTSLYDKDNDSDLALIYGDDPGVDCLIYTALAQWWLGNFELAWAARNEALELARELAHPFSLARALGVSSMVTYWQRDPETVVADAEELLELSTQHRLVIWKATAQVMLGAGRTLLGDAATGNDLFNRGFEKYQATGARLGLDFFRCFIVDAHARNGDANRGIEALEAALGEDQHTPFWIAELHRLSGELGIKIQKTDSVVESEFQKALSVSREQGARALELRAAYSLARFWETRGKTGAAAELLSRVLGNLAEGSGAPDVVDARRLLDALS
jgi:tetratricopeptide (TPR) repeat protein